MAVNDWEADELLLSRVGWNVSAVQLSSPTRRGEGLVIPQRTGKIPTYNRPAEAGEFALSMWVIGCDPSTGSIPSTLTARRQQFDDNLQTLLRVFSTDSHAILFKRTPPSGEKRVAYGMLTGSTDLATMMSRQRGEFTVTFEAIDGYWKDENPTVVTSATGATLPKDLTMASLAGTAVIEDAVITVTGAATNPRLTDLESGVWVQYTGSLSNSDTWVVDAGAFTSKKNGTSVQTATSHGGHARYMLIPPRYGSTNVPTMRLSGSGGSSTTKFSVSACRKWVLP